MNKKFIKMMMIIIGGLLFTTSVSSCGSKTKYLNGEICGVATVDGTNTFSQVRRFYVEQYVHEANAAYVAESGDYSEFAELYDQKFTINDNNQLEIVEYTAENITAYNKAHYIFYYYDTEYGANTSTLVTNYLAANTTDATKAEELVNKLANGTATSNNNSYFIKVNNTELDENTTSVGDAKVTAVSSRMTSHSKACISFTDDFVDPSTGADVQKTTWNYAWETKGFFFCIFVYPFAWMINLFVQWFGGSGWAQVFAIVIVTIIVKLLILLLTFKSQSSTQKMQDIQPEIAQIQAKYGPSPTAQEKQRMSQEMMAVYSKYGVKPFAPFLSLLITFPVFIAMYRAVMFLGILRTGSIGGVVLGNNLNTYILGNFSFFALLIFLMMAGSQILSMKLPQILNRKRMTREAKQSQKSAGMMTNVMMIMILVMGFMMPVLMSIYWIASALVSVVQSVIMHKLNNSSSNGRYKVKTVERKKATIPQGYKSN